MPLLDHFRPPISELQPWESFHARWAVSIADGLNRQLPRRYAAEVQVHLGRRAEADVCEYDRGFPADVNGVTASNNGGGVAVETWAPPKTAGIVPAVFPDDIEIHVNDRGIGGARLVAVVELVSPGNKDRPDARRAFAITTAAYLQRGIGVVVADIVTTMHFNLHNELSDLLAWPAQSRMTPVSATHAAAYRPMRRDDTNSVEFWTYPLAVDQPLPRAPLALRAAAIIPLDLEPSCTDARRNSRLDDQ